MEIEKIQEIAQYNQIAIKLVQERFPKDIMARIIKEKNKLKMQNAKNHHLLRWWSIMLKAVKVLLELLYVTTLNS